jgi:hypothetical protein
MSEIHIQKTYSFKSPTTTNLKKKKGNYLNSDFNYSRIRLRRRVAVSCEVACIVTCESSTNQHQSALVTASVGFPILMQLFSACLVFGTTLICMCVCVCVCVCAFLWKPNIKLQILHIHTRDLVLSV